jgi:hypothetical protein
MTPVPCTRDHCRPAAANRLRSNLWTGLLLSLLVSSVPCPAAANWKQNNVGKLASVRDRLNGWARRPLRSATSNLHHLVKAIHTTSNPAQRGQTGPQVDQLEKAERYVNNVVFHLLGGDLPALLSIAANLGPLPKWAKTVVPGLNALNTFTGVASVVLDARETYYCLKNSRASRTDKLMDIQHLVIGDGVATIASAVPLFFSLSNPWAMGLFVGGQVLGAASDLGKTYYDIKRQGQQSARPNAACSTPLNVTDKPSAGPVRGGSKQYRSLRRTLFAPGDSPPNTR